MTVSAEVRRRERIALPMLTGLYIGLPLVFLVLAAIVQQRASAENDRGFDWVQLIPSAIMLAAGVFLLRRKRPKPVTWSAGGTIFGAIGGLFVFGIIAIQAIGLDGDLFDALSFGFAFAPPVFGGLGWLLGWAARRALTWPVVADLADSQYEWTFPVRGARRVTLTIGLAQVRVLETYTVGSGENSSTRTRGDRFALTTLSEVGAVHLDGSRPPLLPGTIQAAVDTAPGPALTVHSGQYRLVIPVDEADQIAQVIQRRITLARSSPVR